MQKLNEEQVTNSRDDAQLVQDQASERSSSNNVSSELPKTSGMTLMGVLSDILIPLIVGLLTVGVGWAGHKYTQQSDANRTFLEKQAIEDRKLEKSLAEKNRQHQIMSDYLGRMTQLMLEEGLNPSSSKEEIREEVRSAARAVTLNAARQLDVEGKGQLLKFLYEADLIGGQCQLVDAKKVRFGNCQEAILDLSGATLEGAKIDIPLPLQGADLTGALLPNAVLPENVILAEAKMNGINLAGATLNKVSLTNAQMKGAGLEGAKMSNAGLSDAHLQNAILNEATLVNANLKSADLYQASLKRANLQGADLRNATLSEANLKGADLRGADLRGAKLTKDQESFRGAIYDAHTQLDFNPSNVGMVERNR